uniref:Tonsoku-like protein n=1 Tax=Periophthalmus magnuspinnatus TaxID=409849 RepID=A0A3B4A7G0_9GOBI
MSFAREIKQLQKAKSKAQNNNNLREEASICNQLGELLSKNGDYEAAIQEHQQELSLSEVLNDVIGRAVANRKIGECYAELGNIEAALKRCHLDLARSVSDHAEEQRALATIGRTYLFRFESDQSRSSLEQAEDAFKKSLVIVNERLEGMVPQREICEMKARLFLNLGLVCDQLGDPKRCSEFIRRSVFIAEKSELLEDLYRANFNLGNIYFRNGQASNAVRCLEQAKECARKIKDKFSESECFHCIGKVQLSLGDFVAARRSLKKALQLGSQQQMDKQAGCKLEEELGEDQGKRLSPHQAVELTEQLGDLYCKVGCYSKALDAYQAQLTGAEAMGKPSRELAVIHVSLAATYTDLKQYSKAVELYRQELMLRAGSASEECSTWQNIAVVQEEGGFDFSDIDHSFSKALDCAQKTGQAGIQVRQDISLYHNRYGSAKFEDTKAQLQELCAAEGWSPHDSEGEEDEDEDMENSEPLEDSDVILSESGTHYSWNKRNEKGETSLHRACIDGNLKQVQYLIDQGHPVNPRDYCGWTPLHEASNHGHYDIVAALLDRGAYINDSGGPLCEGVTPLHDALACGNLAVARLLIERGASVTLLNSKPLDTLQDSQLFDAENSEPLTSSSQDCTPVSRASQGHSAASPKPPHCNSSHPLRPVRPRHNGTPAFSSQSQAPINKNDLSSTLKTQDSIKDTPAPSVFEREEYHSAIRGLGSAKSRLQSSSQFSSTPDPSTSNRAALVPEEEYVADDWLEDDLGDIQPKKKRRLQLEQSGSRAESSVSTSRNQIRQTHSEHTSRAHTLATHPPIRIRVRVQEDVFLIPVPQSEADSCTVAWLREQAAQRYYQKCGLLPRLQLQKEGALLSLQDPLLAVLHTNEEVLAEVCSWDLPPLPERYKKACQSLAVEENRRVSRLCEVQDGGSCVSVCGLSLAPSSLTPLLRALKLQASLTELRLSGNRLHDSLLPELVATAITMPRLRLLDLSANHITGAGLEKAVTALKGHSHPAFPCLEELDLSFNLLGDSVSEPLSCLLSCCPLLVTLSLQACGLTYHYWFSLSAGMAHLRSLCLSHNALGSTGFELVLKTVPLHSLTHLDLSAVRSGPNECPLTHLSLASNGLTDNSVVTLVRCLASCPALESLDLSGNPSITSAGLYSILASLKEAGLSLSILNLQGCQVSGPWDSTGLDGLRDVVQDMRLCSLTLNKLDRDGLRHLWDTPGHFVDRSAKCLMTALSST